jgi:serine/threonine-protein kinase PknK
MRLRHTGQASGAAPTTFPGYADVSELATGTFATVYRATELGTGRPVALKVMRLAGTSPHTVEIFKKELSALSLLSNHPNVTTLYRSFFTPDGRPVLVLELCRGSLAERARREGPLSPAETAQVGVKIAGALETAHRSGLLHRDMKPQNILVSQFGEPVLADFGVAALQAAAQSSEGMFGFTTLHAPPEALEGHPLGPAADVYGLASSMYQLLLGRGPFASYEGEAPASVILRILRDPAPRAPVTGMPVALADLLQRCLDKDPDRRPQSAGELAEQLRAIEEGAGWAPTPYVVWGPGQSPALVGAPPAQGPAPGPVAGAPAPVRPAGGADAAASGTAPTATPAGAPLGLAGPLSATHQPVPAPPRPPVVGDLRASGLRGSGMAPGPAAASSLVTGSPQAPAEPAPGQGSATHRAPSEPLSTNLRHVLQPAALGQGVRPGSLLMPRPAPGLCARPGPAGPVGPPPVPRAQPAGALAPVPASGSTEHAALRLGQPGPADFTLPPAPMAAGAPAWGFPSQTAPGQEAPSLLPPRIVGPAPDLPSETARARRTTRARAALAVAAAGAGAVLAAALLHLR